jgi:hypothetical protein
MKSSTIRRSTLSKESMEVIEALARESENDGSIGEYVRSDEIESRNNTKENDYSKTQEIDLLWQNFKATQFNTNSPTAYILMGFVAGIIATLLVLFCIGWFSGKNTPVVRPADTQIEQTEMVETQEVEDTTSQEVAPAETEQQQEVTDNTTEDTKVEVPAKQEKVKTKKYVVKNGDTGESIIKHFYGSYTPERAEKIIQINNLKNLDRINIDQELLIPIEK